VLWDKPSLSTSNTIIMLTATKVQATTYLLGVCLFSISFLVFLNSSVSFVITDIIKEHKGVGDAVGTLGFADELVALVACPLWGILSDRIGVRTVRHLLHSR
jgi:MFS family permease